MNWTKQMLRCVKTDVGTIEIDGKGSATLQFIIQNKLQSSWQGEEGIVLTRHVELDCV